MAVSILFVDLKRVAKRSGSTGGRNSLNDTE